jgi:hypothetical protein
MEKKMATSIESLTKGYPSEFATYLAYVKSLKFEEKPDYPYLKNLFKVLFKKLGYEMDYKYEWVKPNVDKANEEEDNNKYKDINMDKQMTIKD